MTKTRFCALIMLLLPVFPVSAGHAAEAALVFSASVPQPGIWSIRITGNLGDLTQCLLMVTEPDNAVLLAVLDPGADERLIDAIIELNPVHLDFCWMRKLNLKAEMDQEPSAINRISFQKASLQKGNVVIEEIVGVFSNTFDLIEFGIDTGTDASGCIPMARCGTGRPFWGPQCDPCDFTVCCYGSMGFIQCGEILCP